MQGRGGRGGRGGGYQWRDRIDRQASGECTVRKGLPSESVVFLVVCSLLFIPDLFAILLKFLATCWFVFLLIVSENDT